MRCANSGTSTGGSVAIQRSSAATAATTEANASPSCAVARRTFSSPAGR
jgi:hypothetical protein